MNCSTTTPFLHHRHHHLHHRCSSSQISCSSTNLNRRSLLFLSSTTSLSSLSSLSLSLAAEQQQENASTTQRQQQQPLPPPPPPSPPPTTPSPADTTVTDRIFMDFSICPDYFRSDRTLGDELSTCQDFQPLGRVVFGLYGKIVPQIVANFKAMCIGLSGSSYKGTLVQKIFPDKYFIAGRQGRREKGVVRPPLNLSMNNETLDSKAYVLGHSRAGLLSLCLSENDDEDDIKFDPGYRNVEFLVTTGPGPCPMLDDRNIVFGTVLQGIDVVTTISSIPIYKPGERIRQFNDFAEFLGDERAQNARTIWNRPLKTIYISDCGELKVAKPSLSPTLP